MGVALPDGFSFVMGLMSIAVPGAFFIEGRVTT
jgi:hypothetical protein